MGFGGWRCPKCILIFTGDDAVKDGIVTCPSCHCSWVVEKRCGTCEHGQEYRCCRVRVQVVGVTPNGEADGGYLTDDDGPPWDNCRFWKQREET